MVKWPRIAPMAQRWIAECRVRYFVFFKNLDRLQVSLTVITHYSIWYTPICIVFIFYLCEKPLQKTKLKCLGAHQTIFVIDKKSLDSDTCNFYIVGTSTHRHAHPYTYTHTYPGMYAGNPRLNLAGINLPTGTRHMIHSCV